MRRGAKYFGERTDAGCRVYVKHGLKWVPLQTWPDQMKSAPAGVDWGFMCSGSPLLSLAILADHLQDNQRALELYRDFEFMVVARLNRNERLLSGEEIDEVIADAHRGLKISA